MALCMEQTSHFVCLCKNRLNSRWEFKLESGQGFVGVFLFCFFWLCFPFYVSFVLRASAKGSWCEMNVYKQLIKQQQHPVGKTPGTGTEQKPVENCGVLSSKNTVGVLLVSMDNAINRYRFIYIVFWCGHFYDISVWLATCMRRCLGVGLCPVYNLCSQRNSTAVRSVRLWRIDVIAVISG